jgi:triacylglycerol lipase
MMREKLALGTMSALLVAGCGGGGASLPAARAPQAVQSTSSSSVRQHDPLILIPGMTSPASEMQPMADNFIRAGWSTNRVFVWTDSTDMEGDLAIAAGELKGEIGKVLAQTGAHRVALVTWSASALSARYYIKNIDSTTVSTYVGMAGPQHGTTFNSCQAYVSCQEFSSPNTPFLTALNAGTEIPGSPRVAYMTIRSDNDINVAPESSAELAGANVNLQLSGVTAPNHFQYPFDATTFDDVKTFIVEVENNTEPRPTLPP